MEATFYKLQGAGNDFICFAKPTKAQQSRIVKRIAKLCNRRFGIGADGVIILGDSKIADLRMIYYNADGKEGSFCGNGARCTVRLAHTLKMFQKQCMMEAYDGLHHCEILGKRVGIEMKPIEEIKSVGKDYFIDSGSPHHICLVSDLEDSKLMNRAKKIRNAARYQPGGTNVNFVKISNNGLNMRTFERGVEGETLSCGTGVVASAVLAKHLKKVTGLRLKVETKGGVLEVLIRKSNGSGIQTFLVGPAELVYRGSIEL